MAILGTTRLKVANGSAAVERLWNGRFRLEFFCDPVADKTDWYHANIGGILPEFLDSQDHFFGAGVDESWQAIPESVYPNMVCVESGYKYIPSIDEKRVSLAYETLTDAWVQEKDDTIDYDLNGLKRVSRQSVALPNTAYAKVVGTTSMDSNGTTVYLAKYQIDETDAKWTLTEIWLEAGTLNVSTTTESTGLNRVSTTFLHIEGVTNGPIISRSEQNIEGLKTITVTTLERSDGKDITDSTPVNSFGAMFNFTYPGVVGAASVTATSVQGGAIDTAINRFFYQSSPVQRPIPATSYVFFQTDPLPSSADYVYDGALGLWSPSEWAGGIYYGWRYQRDNFGTPIGERPSFRGFRAVESDNEISGVFRSLSGVATDDDGLSGTLLLNGTTFKISVSGGPEKPDGNKYTLGTIDIEPAFIDESGVQYYKKVITVSTIPPQGGSVIT
jgi:hypothetical protein